MSETNQNKPIEWPAPLVGKHLKFCQRHLHLLPPHHQDKDPNRLAVIFYALTSIQLLSERDADVGKQHGYSLEWLRSCYVECEGVEGGGILSGFAVCSMKEARLLSTMSLPNTLFGLISLMLLRDGEFVRSRVCVRSLGALVSRCQLPDGSFVSFLREDGSPARGDAHDLRFCYVAVAILRLVGCRTRADFERYIDVGGGVEFICSRECSVGGFGECDEPHGGYTSCALSALAILGELDQLDRAFRERTVRWLVDRQVWEDAATMTSGDSVENEDYDPDDCGGFNGRENKLADTCYAFWCLNALSILCPDDWRQLVDLGRVQSYLMDQTQNKLIGGWAKNDQDDPDIYHTMMGIAALKLIDGELDGVLCMPTSIVHEFGLR